MILRLLKRKQRKFNKNTRGWGRWNLKEDILINEY
jgi:hypothetical protein